MNSVFGLPTWCSSIPRDDDGANCQMFWKRNDITFGSPKNEMVFPTSWGCFLVTTLVDIAIQSSQRIWTMMCCWRWRTSLWLLEKLKKQQWDFVGMIWKIWKNYLVGFKHEWIIFHFIIFHLWDVIRNPLTNSLHHFSRWWNCTTTNQICGDGEPNITGEVGDITVTTTRPGKQRKCYWKWPST